MTKAPACPKCGRPNFTTTSIAFSGIDLVHCSDCGAVVGAVNNFPTHEFAERVEIALKEIKNSTEETLFVVHSIEQLGQ